MICLILLNILLLTHQGATADAVNLNIELFGADTDDIQVFYGTSQDFSAENSAVQPLSQANELTTLSFQNLTDTSFTRIDFGSKKNQFVITDISYEYNGEVQTVDLSALSKDAVLEQNQIASFTLNDGVLEVVTEAGDPYIVLKMGPTDFAESARQQLARSNMIKNVIYAVLVDVIALILFLMRKRFITLPMELIQNRGLIFSMAKNDFKTKYAGSVLGTVWAFVPPCVTVLVYWFVFGLLGNGDVVSQRGISYPFVLWLIAGLVPWFFFQDTLIGGTSALLEYSYLVKKVVFKISVLPIVKEISAVFVHMFFIALMMILYIVAGFFPNIYWIQVFYYSAALAVYSLAWCFITCSIVVFFRDLSQLISIIIQVQIWMTPIMWNMDQFGQRIPGWVQTLLKLNPLYYIVCGYRDSMMNQVWFWEHLDLTMYFWGVTIAVFGLGSFVFKRLKPHFADIL